MKEELKDLLLEHLGELLYNYENNDDYNDKLIAKDKIKAVETLLDIK